MNQSLSNWQTLEEILEDATLEDLGKAYLWNQDQMKLLREDLNNLITERDGLLKLINTPIVDDFMKALPLEAAHQQHKWGVEHDAGKNCLNWFWLIGYLAQKIVVNEQAGNHEKALHHCITTAAALLNWHRHLLGEGNMRPGISSPEQEPRS